MPGLTIEPWNDRHPRWDELIKIVDDVQQAGWFSTQCPWHLGSHVLVALQDGVICGFLRFVRQVIGEDEDCGPVMLHGKPLMEAKVLAFAVTPEYRRRGVGRALQTYAMRYAAEHHCYQLRSHSSGENEANHQLKLSMGFGVHPIIRGDDKRGAYFVMPLYALWGKQD